MLSGGSRSVLMDIERAVRSVVRAIELVCVNLRGCVSHRYTHV